MLKKGNLVFSHFINIDQQQIHIRLRQLSFERDFRSVFVFEFVREKYHEMINMKWFTLLFLVNAVFCADHNPDGKHFRLKVIKKKFDNSLTT